MAASDLVPVFTENFSNNLESLRDFLGVEGRSAFEQLLDRLFDDIVPTICRFPMSGRALLQRPIQSIETETRVKQIQQLLRPEDELREFIVDEYIVLYMKRSRRLLFLAIKHHRQLSFEFNQFWA